MNITFSKLKELAESFDLSTLSEEDADSLLETQLFEQARSRNDFINLVDNLGYQIAENICLILFMQQYRENIQTINHWKSELYAHCLNIQKKKVKSGNKEELLKHIFFNIMDFYDKEHVYDILWDKFNTEGISIFDESYAVYDVVEQFQVILKEDIIPLLINTKQAKELYQYISEL